MRWYWQLYIFLILGGSLLQMLRKILTDTGGPSSRYGALIVALVIIVMMVAHWQQRALGKAWMWKILFGVLSLGAVVMLFFAIYLLITGVLFAGGLLLSGAIGLLPALYQLYHYAFRADTVWQ